jgi:hypothetical protein
MTKRVTLALAVLLAAVFVAVPTASGGGSPPPRGQSADHSSGNARAEASRTRHQRHVRTGKFVDADTTPGDGLWNFASGHAQCKRGETLVGGGVRRIHSDGLFPGLRWALQESGPVPSERKWAASAASDLGGLGRKDFIVIAICQS